MVEKMQDVAVTLDPDDDDMLLAWAKLGFIVAANIELKASPQSMNSELVALKGVLDWLARNPTG